MAVRCGSGSSRCSSSRCGSLLDEVCCSLICLQMINVNVLNVKKDSLMNAKLNFNIWLGQTISICNKVQRYYGYIHAFLLLSRYTIIVGFLFNWLSILEDSCLKPWITWIVICKVWQCTNDSCKLFLMNFWYTLLDWMVIAAVSKVVSCWEQV